MLLDRRDEISVLDRLLAGARAGRSGVLVLNGAAGVGKTALLDHVLGSVSDMTRVRAAGVESEMELAFAALHQLFMPLLEWQDRLPQPQREALSTAFGLSEGAAPDRFFVGLAMLGLVSEAAEQRPLVCVVDDAQWLDRASAQVLGFVARRLLAEPVVMLFGARAPTEELAGLPELPVHGLEDPDARALLASVIPGRLDETVADQIVAETRGNPLALLELPYGLSAAQLAGGFGLPGALSLDSRIEESYQRRVQTLPEDTQRLLLVAAAEPLGDPALLWRAAMILGITGDVLVPAERAGLLEIDERVRFRHPLARSAVYAAAPSRERREAHRALAQATDAHPDPDRHAWHLAKATAGPDENVAFELERAAGRAQARGGVAAAGAFLERAAELTAEPSSRGRRALAAARAKYEAGALDDAVALLATAEKGAADDLQRAQVQLLRARIAFALRRGSDAPPLLLKAARDLEAVDPSLARTTYLEALSAGIYAGRFARSGGVREVSESALAGPPPPQPSRPSDLLLQGLAVRFTEGYAAGAPILKEAVSAFRRETVLSPEDVRWLGFATMTATQLWDDEAWAVLTKLHVDFVRETGTLTSLPFILSNLSSTHASYGELGVAASYEAELRAATEATGIAPFPYSMIWRAALRGREAEFSELNRGTVREAQARGEGLAVAVYERVSGVLYNGLGRYDAALAAVRQAERYPNEVSSLGTLPELIEAAVRSGQPELAGTALGRITEATMASGTDWGLGIGVRCRALLSDGDEAESLYQEAIERLDRTRGRVQLARAHLLYGEWLRRQRRRLDARERLRTAFEMFTAMGIDGFAARTERELRATGERVRKRRVETSHELTAQESQVARLAYDGLSNAEIGERLFISQHTVAYHLRKVFTKLDITSRNQLASALPDDDHSSRKGTAGS